jgi:adenylate cyclase class 2
MSCLTNEMQRSDSTQNTSLVNLTATPSNLEVEVKFLVADLAAFRRRLLEAGANLLRQRVYERNVRFDTAGDALLQRDELLRLRQDNGVVITFKGAAQAGEQSEAKVREELEIAVDDFEMAAAIFDRLGFRAKQVYEKYRESFLLEEVEVVLDEMPFGNFVELEGNEADIKQIAGVLGLEWRQRIIINYLGLMAMLKEHHQLPFDDLTFANFAGLQVSVRDVIGAPS